MRMWEKNKRCENFETEVVLVDIEKFSKLSAEDQLLSVVTAQAELERLVALTSGQSALELSEVVIGYVPTGDGFYVVMNPDLYSHGLMLALSIRSILLTLPPAKKRLIPGLRIAVHFGELSTFVDITDRKNFVGPVMNDCARLLGVDTKKAPSGLLPDENFVFCSIKALERFSMRYDLNSECFKQLGTVQSETVQVTDKHGTAHEGRFIECSRHVAFNAPKPKDFDPRMLERLKQWRDVNETNVEPQQPGSPDPT
jgi:hypothetical protein